MFWFVEENMFWFVGREGVVVWRRKEGRVRFGRGGCFLREERGRDGVCFEGGVCF